MQREQVEPRCVASEGYDIPPYAGMLDFKVWERSSRPWAPSITIRSAMAQCAAQPDGAARRHRTSRCQIYNRAIHNQMMARLKEGQTIPQVIAWAKEELEGFTR